MLCHDCCVEAGFLEERKETGETTSSIEVIRERVLGDLAQSFFDKAKLFSTGPRLRKEGRAPYFYLLYWLASQTEWTLNVSDSVKKNPEHRGSIGQILDKGFLADHIERNPDLQDVIHFEKKTTELSIEDPKFFYYIKNLLWSKFCEQVGYRSVDFNSRYDYALSFSGHDRDVADKLFEYLSARELSVFYDKNEQHRILAQNVADYLAPIYKSEASFVLVLLGPEYPNRIWTKFESDHFKDRFGQNTVIPVWFKQTPPGMFDTSRDYGGLTFDRHESLEDQIEAIGTALCRKIEVDKEENSSLELLPSVN